MDFSEEMKILAFGYDNGIVTLTNMKSLSSEGTLTEHKKVIFCHFLDDYPGIIVCDLEGVVHFWSLVLTKPKKLIRDYKLLNKSINDNHALETFPIKCACFEKSTNILFMGDETGYVKAYNISEYITYLKLMLPCSKIEYSNNIPNFEGKTVLSPYLEQKKQELLNMPKYDPESGKECVISLNDLLEIANSMDFTPILLAEWQAHKHGITSVCCHDNPVFFCTSGHDLKVKIWNEKFELIGNLTTITDKNWKVNINIKKERERAREEAKQKYHELKDLEYEKLFEKSDKNDDD